MDVRALYTSVPRAEARKAARESLNNRSNQEVSTTTVLDLMDFVLENNNIQFYGNNYRQVEGTAIGSKLGCNYACTYLGAWERELLENVNKTPYVMFRYIDDIWGIWTHGEESLNDFHAAANSIHPNLKLELRTSRSSIEFVDVFTTITTERTISTKLFSKETDKHLYLHATSSHPSHVKRAIPYGLAVRIKRICSKEEDYNKEKESIRRRLCARGYIKTEVDNQLQKADRLDRNDLFKQKDKTQGSKIPLTLEYSKSLINIRNTF
jgi:uncharacterized protein YggL (DUF469 family)